MSHEDLRMCAHTGKASLLLWVTIHANISFDVATSHQSEHISRHVQAALAAFRSKSTGCRLYLDLMHELHTHKV